MMQGRTGPSRRDAMLDRLGGPPAGYVVASVVLGVLWFPFRLLLDEGDPTDRIIAASAFQGAVWALIPLAGQWGLRLRRRFGRTGAVDPPAVSQDSRGWARRGAIVGLSVGVPFFTALIALCLTTGRSWIYTAGFGIILLATTAVAAKALRHSAAVGG